MLTHGAVLRKNFFSGDELTAIVRDFRNAGLAPEEVAIMSFAQANQISEHDFNELRGHGLSDEDILDVVLASAARSFISKTLDALGVKPDTVSLELESELLQLLAIGRPLPSC